MNKLQVRLLRPTGHRKTSHASQGVGACVLSRFSPVQLFAIPWTVARKAPLSMGFSRREYWSGLPCLLQGIFLTQGSNSSLLCLLRWQSGSLPLAPPGKSLSEGTTTLVSALSPKVLYLEAGPMSQQSHSQSERETNAYSQQKTGYS